jgi:3-hydroxyisobutyrate dehydrogenase
MRIAFLGTGIMGAPMARNIAAAGHDVTAWNRSVDKARPLEQHGVKVAEDPAVAVDGAEAIVTMLADGPAVEDTMAAAAAAATPGALWWQASTVGIAANERLAALAAEHGLRYVDAPVLGTRGPAESGDLVILTSGEAADVEACAPMFEAAGSRTVPLGAAGEATRLKLVLNHWVVGITNALAETIGMAEGVGIDPQRFLDGIAGGALDIGYAGLKGPGMIAGELPVTFALKLALKDVNLMLEAGERHDLDLALARTIRDRYAAAVESGHGDQDMGMIIAAIREANAASG